MNFLKEFSLEDAFVGKCVPCLYCKSPHFFLLPLSRITSRADQQFPHEIRIIKLSPPDLLAVLMDTGYILNSCLVVVVVDQCLRDRVLKTKTF